MSSSNCIKIKQEPIDSPEICIHKIPSIVKVKNDPDELENKLLIENCECCGTNIPPIIISNNFKVKTESTSQKEKHLKIVYDLKHDVTSTEDDNLSKLRISNNYRINFNKGRPRPNRYPMPWRWPNHSFKNRRNWFNPRYRYPGHHQQDNLKLNREWRNRYASRGNVNNNFPIYKKNVILKIKSTDCNTGNSYITPSSTSSIKMIAQVTTSSNMQDKLTNINSNEIELTNFYNQQSSDQESETHITNGETSSTVDEAYVDDNVTNISRKTDNNQENINIDSTAKDFSNQQQPSDPNSKAKFMINDSNEESHVTIGEICGEEPMESCLVSNPDSNEESHVTIDEICGEEPMESCLVSNRDNEIKSHIGLHEHEKELLKNLLSCNSVEPISKSSVTETELEIVKEMPIKDDDIVSLEHKKKATNVCTNCFVLGRKEKKELDVIFIAKRNKKTRTVPIINIEEVEEIL